MKKHKGSKGVVRVAGKWERVILFSTIGFFLLNIYLFGLQTARLSFTIRSDSLDSVREIEASPNLELVEVVDRIESGKVPRYEIVGFIDFCWRWKQEGVKDEIRVIAGEDKVYGFE